ncbi:MAG TPA: ACT domain-containing protein [Candidatus Xenobia bacterium]
MKKHLLLSLVGPDRTGLVDMISGAIFKHRGNLEDSRMAVLGGEFAMLLLVTVPDEARAELEAAVQEAAHGLGLLLTVKPTTPRRVPTESTALELRVEGMDHEGIVHDIVHFLAEQGVSVETLESSVTMAPHTGSPLFSMHLHLDVPPAMSLNVLEHGLVTVADRLNVTLEFDRKVTV